MSVDIQHCMRVFGGSCRECVCMLPAAAGWAECPLEAKGLIPERKSALPFRHVKIASMQPRTSSLAGEFCHSCGGPNMIRTGTCMTCGDCGDSSGGCS